MSELNPIEVIEKIQKNPIWEAIAPLNNEEESFKASFDQVDPEDSLAVWKALKKFQAFFEKEEVQIRLREHEFPKYSDLMGEIYKNTIDDEVPEYLEVFADRLQNAFYGGFLKMVKAKKAKALKARVKGLHKALCTESYKKLKNEELEQMLQEGLPKGPAAAVLWAHRHSTVLFWERQIRELFVENFIFDKKVKEGVETLITYIPTDRNGWKGKRYEDFLELAEGLLDSLLAEDFHAARGFALRAIRANRTAKKPWYDPKGDHVKLETVTWGSKPQVAKEDEVAQVVTKGKGGRQAATTRA